MNSNITSSLNVNANLVPSIGVPVLDEVYGTDGDDTLRCQNLDEMVYGYSGNDLISGKGGNDWIFGDYGTDTIQGNAGGDVLEGGIGNDVLNGGADRDVLIGGPGVDILIGGKAPDSFFFGELTNEVDIIKDFNLVQGDVIVIDRPAFGASDLSEFSYNPRTGYISFNGEEFVKLANKPANFDVNSQIELGDFFTWG